MTDTYSYCMGIMRELEGRAKTRPRLICAGLMKSGLSSLRYAVKALGWSALGYVRGEGLNYPDMAGQYDAVFDLPAAAMWRVLVNRYQYAKVIYTPRDTESWLESIEDWLDHHPFTTPAEQSWARKLYGSVEFDRPTYEQAKLRQDREVCQWARENPSRFLLFDVIGGDEWEKLCQFLGVPIPTDANGKRLPFPRVRPGAPRSTWQTAGVRPVGEEGETWRS